MRRLTSTQFRFAAHPPGKKTKSSNPLIELPARPLRPSSKVREQGSSVRNLQLVVWSWDEGALLVGRETGGGRALFESVMRSPGRRQGGCEARREAHRGGSIKARPRWLGYAGAEAGWVRPLVRHISRGVLCRT